MKRISKSRVYYAAAFLLFSAALGVLLYPYASDRLYRYAAGQEISGYEKEIASEDAAQLEQARLQAEKYNRSLSGAQAAGGEKALPGQENDARKNGADTVSMADYAELLAVTDAIGYLEIPKLSVRLPIYHGLDDEVLRMGIGHMPETSLPVGGPSTHCVLSGHSGLPAAKLLTDLDQMQKGDLFYLHVLNEVLAYEVDQICVVLPEDTKPLAIEEGRDLVTLLTCTPYGINTHRLLVRGERTEYAPPKLSLAAGELREKEQGISPKMAAVLLAAVFAVLVLGITLLILFLPGRKRQRKE